MEHDAKYYLHAGVLVSLDLVPQAPDINAVPAFGPLMVWLEEQLSANACGLPFTLVG